MRIKIGTIVRKKGENNPILVYTLREGRKHPWFKFCGYNLEEDTLVNHLYEGRRFLEVYKVLEPRCIESLLTHKYERARQLGQRLAEGKLKEIKRIFETDRQNSQPVA